MDEALHRKCTRLASILPAPWALWKGKPQRLCFQLALKHGSERWAIDIAVNVQHYNRSSAVHHDL